MRVQQTKSGRRSNVARDPKRASAHLGSISIQGINSERKGLPELRNQLVTLVSNIEFLPCRMERRDGVAPSCQLAKVAIDRES